MQVKAVGVLSVVVSAVVGIGLLPGVAAAQSNPIVIENQQPGTSSWQIPWGAQGSDGTGQIKGYGSAPSVNKGEPITFFVSVNPAQNYTIDIYRLGWYQGLGGRLMQHIGPLAGVHQTTCPTDATTGMIECHWTPSYTLTPLNTWTSGVYVALLTNAQSFQNYIVFTVRDDSRIAPLLYQQQVTTYQAYNDYPYDSSTGKSLYSFNSYGAKTISGGANAVKVSFDRPYNFDGSGTGWGQSFLSWEYSFIRWIEKLGYDITYTTDVDTHINGARLLNYTGIISGAHDEYYSKEMYNALISARDAGVNLAFFGADSIGWQIRFEPSSNGVTNRVIVCYRDATLDPNPDPTLKTVEWTAAPLNRPEQTLKGVQYTTTVPWHSATNAWADYVVTNSNNWVYAGTGFKDGDTVKGIVGYEADRFFSGLAGPPAAPGTFTLLSQSPLGNGGANDYSNSSVYQATSGAWVFTSGTTAWGLGLDNYNGYNLVDARIQQTTANVLNRFANPTVNFGLSASPTSQAVVRGGSASYGVTISPTGGFSGQVALSVSGVPTGANATFAPNPATTSSTLSVSTGANTPAGTYALTITATSGALVHTATVSLVVNLPPDFSLTPSPASQNVLQGGSTNYSITVNPANGFSGQVTLSLSGLPTDATGNFSVNPTTGLSTLTVNTTATTPLGTYTLTVTGTSGTLTHTTTVSLVLSLPDFTLSPSPSSRTVIQGNQTSYGVTINPINGFNGPVTLSVTGLPPAAGGGFSPNPATTSSTLTVTTDATTPAGSYTLTITGTSGALTHTTTVSLIVVAPDFSLAGSPASQTVSQGNSTSYTVTISPINNFSGQVNLSVTNGLPAGAGSSFSVNPATTSSTLTVTTTSATPAGTYTLTITGTSGTLTHTATVSLTVNRPGVLYDAAVTSGFQWGVTSASTPAFTIGTGVNRAAMIMVSMSANNATGITARLGGVTGTLVPGTDTGTTTSVRTMIFQVINPPSGSQTATVFWTTAVHAVVSVITVSGADQTTPVTNGTFVAFTSAPSNTSSLTVTSSPGDLTATIAFTSAAWVAPYTNQSLTWGPASGEAAGDRGAGNGTTTHTWTDQWANQTVAISGANFKSF